MKIYHPGKRHSGFTLAELLVAMAITVTLVSLVVIITGTALDTWRAARNEVRASRQAKIMLDALGRDLESFVVRSNNNNEWLLAQTAQEEIGPDGQESPNAATLVFLTAAADRYGGNVGDSTVDKGGDISAVGYQLKFEDPVFSDTDERFSKFVLYRNLINPDLAFQGIIGSEDLEGAFSGYAGSGSDPEDFMCENIYEFSVGFVVEYFNQRGEKQIVRVPVIETRGANSVEKFVITGGGIETDDSEPEYGDGTVISVDLSITVLSDTGMRQLRNRTFRDTDAKAKFLAENSYPYSKTVIIPRP